MSRTIDELVLAFGTVLVFVAAPCCSGQVPFVLNDTTFLQRDTAGGHYHAVFIEAARQSTSREQPILNVEGEALVAAQLLDLRETLAARCPAERPPLAEQWVPVYPFEGALYSYSPCDRMFAYGVWLRAGHVVEALEGPEVSLVRTVASTDTVCEMLWYSITAPKGTRVRVRTVDEATGIALWTIGDEQPAYRLMVPAEKANLLSWVVNHCPERKWMEFQFDAVDPAKLYKP